MFWKQEISKMSWFLKLSFRNLEKLGYDMKFNFLLKFLDVSCCVLCPSSGNQKWHSETSFLEFLGGHSELGSEFRYLRGWLHLEDFLEIQNLDTKVIILQVVWLMKRKQECKWRVSSVGIVCQDFWVVIKLKKRLAKSFVLSSTNGIHLFSCSTRIYSLMQIIG